MTYDSGQNSTDNHAHIEGLRLGYVTSLPPSDHPDLLAIGHDQFDVVAPDRFDGVTAHDTVVEALGVTRRAVITHSTTFHQRQAAGFEQTLAKARRQLAELQARLARGRTRKNAAAIQTEIDTILAPRWLDRVITTTLT
ncbi:MAG: transposase, partial [Kiloniellaceae bacterium]|nr:transposase [Kiloniellaceae bacterium]